jgi:gamma-glutamyltranspeptidase/glutathione hydrolase
MDRARAIATASEGSAAEAATAVLAKGNAVDAVVAGVFAAAAASPSVLLGPVQILFGGAGLGLRYVDGRVRQAGKGAPRPRGFTADQTIPAAARVGVPGLPAALAAALASSGSSTLAQVMAPAVAAASGPRKDLLRKLAQRGPSVLAHDSGVVDELIAVCGRLAGGLLTRDDLDAILPSIAASEELRLPGPARVAAFVPERASALLGEEPTTLSAPHVEVVAAADYRGGLLAVACYERPDDGVTIDALGLVAPVKASPVLRGQTRVPPGALVQAAAPMALVRNASEASLDVALAVARDANGERTLGDALAAWSNDEAQGSPGYDGTGSLVGVFRTKGGASLLTRR